jgi:mannitol/fructose-specific phosphotransferase system IIA component (Ntr-type)
MLIVMRMFYLGRHNSHERRYVDENYLSALLKRELEYPTGLAVGEDSNVAILHGDIKYVLRESLVIIKTKEPVLFRKMNERDKQRLWIYFSLRYQGSEQIY